jgi:selenide,water dikinase
MRGHAPSLWLMSQDARLTSFSHGAGCACKLSPVELAEAIKPLLGHPATESADLLVGFQTSDDAAIYRFPDGGSLVLTIDFFTPIVDSAYDWGRIAAANALSDVYAMGGMPITALQIVGWPRETLPFSLLGEVIRGGADVMAQAGTTIVGGHSVDDREPKYGFAITGFVETGRHITNAGAVAGDVLILTKPLGMGVVSTAIKRGACPPNLAAEAIRVMALLNDGAAWAMKGVGVNAATDITGFGLLGHVREMLVASGVAAVIDVAQVPVLEGVPELVGAGYYPGGSQRNLEAVRPHLQAGGINGADVRILADAQTSGGLLIAVPGEKAATLVDKLIAEQTAAASIIGRIESGAGWIKLI